MNQSVKLLIPIKEVVKASRFFSTKFKSSDHPYRKIHPWKSPKEMSEFLLNNLIYNKDGLVALNKPYGIAIHPLKVEEKSNKQSFNKIVNAVPYTISESLNYISAQLNYPKLTVIKSPEKFMTGLMLLSANENVSKKVLKGTSMGNVNKHLTLTYWIVTTKLPKIISGDYKLALGIRTHEEDPKLTAPVLLKEWTKNEVKRGIVNPFQVKFKLLSNSTNNLASLIEISIGKRKWNAIRMFAADILHSPILGDNIYGYLIQKVMESYVNVGPFSDLRGQLPKLNGELLATLKIPKQDQEIIPVHIHLRKIRILNYFKGEDLILEAPLMPEFQWTCDTLQFKYLMPDQNVEAIKSEQALHDVMEQMRSVV